MKIENLDFEELTEIAIKRALALKRLPEEYSLASEVKILALAEVVEARRVPELPPEHVRHGLDDGGGGGGGRVMVEIDPLHTATGHQLPATDYHSSIWRNSRRSSD